MVMLPMLAFIVTVGLVQSPLTLYDSVSYHLVFPARWLQDRRLSIVPTPFSDPAQAYQPGNGELFFLWLMMPFHWRFSRPDRPAPLSAAQRRVSLRHRPSMRRASRPCGLRAPVLPVLARPIVEQAVGADVDLVCTAMFLTSIFFGIAAIDSDVPRDWALWGVSVGLFLGTKYLALGNGLSLLVLPLLRGPRLKALWAIPGLVVFGLPWYARNWIVAGSPVIPPRCRCLAWSWGAEPSHGTR